MNGRMMRALKISLKLLAASLMVAAAHSQQTKTQQPKATTEAKPAAASTSAAPTAPKPAPEMEQLSKMLVGRWAIEEKFESSESMPGGLTGKASESIRPGPARLSVIADYHSSTMPGGYDGHAVVTWSPEEKVYRMYWVDSGKPGAVVRLGKWESKDLVFRGPDEMSGRKVTIKETFTDITPDSFTFYMDISPAQGGEARRFMTLKYKRDEAPARPRRGSRDEAPAEPTKTPRSE